MTFFWLNGLYFLLTIPIIILLYLLKQKHPSTMVPSLKLWNFVVQDVKASSPWQKLKKNTLLILQIILLALLALFISKPFFDAYKQNFEKYILVIDSSFSMQAKDVSPSRFKKAQNDAIEFISNTAPNTEFTLIDVGMDAVIRENLTSNKSLLIDRVKNIKVTDDVLNIENLNMVLKGMLKNTPSSQVLIYSDTPIKIKNVNISHNQIIGEGTNYAILSMTHTKIDEKYTMLSKVANYSKKDETLPLSLYVDGTIFDAQNIKLNKGEIKDVFWNKIPLDARKIECRIDKTDYLEKDNIYYAGINTPNINKAVLVSENNVFIEKVLGLIEGISLFKSNLENVDSIKNYNLYIYDKIVPSILPQDGNIIIFNPTPNKHFEVLEETSDIVLKKSSHQIFKYIEDYSFNISKSKTLKLPSWGREVLMSNKGLLSFFGTYKNSKIIVFSFDIHNTDLPLKISFPIIINNCIDMLVDTGISTKNQNILPKENISYNLHPNSKELYLEKPNNERVLLAPPFPVKKTIDTKEVGIYTLEENVETTLYNYYFAVNVPSNKESNLISNIMISTQIGGIETNLNLLPKIGLNLQYILIWIILSIILIEWWVYTNEL